MTPNLSGRVVVSVATVLLVLLASTPSVSARVVCGSIEPFDVVTAGASDHAFTCDSFYDAIYVTVQNEVRPTGSLPAVVVEPAAFTICTYKADGTPISCKEACGDQLLRKFADIGRVEIRMEATGPLHDCPAVRGTVSVFFGDE